MQSKIDNNISGNPGSINTSVVKSVSDDSAAGGDEENYERETADVPTLQDDATDTTLVDGESRDKPADKVTERNPTDIKLTEEQNKGCDTEIVDGLEAKL